MIEARDIVKRYVRQMRLAQLARYAVYALPLLLFVVYSLPRIAALTLAERVLAGLLAALLQIVVTDLIRWRQRVTREHAQAHLDRRFPQLEDSSELLLRRPEALGPIAQLQRARVEAAVLSLAESGRLQPLGWRRLPGASAVALIITAVALNLLWIVPLWQQDVAQQQRIASAASVVERVIADIEPPAYTGLAVSTAETASVELPEFTRLRFTVTLDGSADSLSIISGDDKEVELYQSKDGRWQSTWWQPGPATYRFVADGVVLPVIGQGSVHTIAVSSDLAPVVNITAPTSRLQSMSEQTVAPLLVALEIDDDFGVDSVVAHITRSSGSGEQVEFENQQVTLFSPAAGAEARVTLRETFDPLALGLEAGSELYLHFEAHDERPGLANVGKSQTLIIRWQGGDAAPDIVLDNQVVQVMPEYFRSQRQIIIDSEALLAERELISSEVFDQRAQSLALDQKALRLRYGTFMGEEDDSEPSAMPAETSDGEGHYVGDGHDHADEDFIAAARPQASSFGDVEAAIEPYAHFHDQEEQATLFDPETRGLLRQALGAMWQAEGELRQFRPQPSLPHQYQALALIKRVQNRSRVYVERVGFEPTPVDPERRLTGELEDVAPDATLAAAAAASDSAALSRAVLAMLSEGESADATHVDSVRQWLQAQLLSAQSAGDDTLLAATLDAQAALEQWQLDAACDDCQARISRYWQRHAPEQRAPAARSQQAFDAFSEGSDD